jgi:hypothetical protein
MAQPPQEPRRIAFDIIKALAASNPITAVGAELADAVEGHQRRRWEQFVNLRKFAVRRGRL